jgi:hypothetical protein
MSDGVPEVDEDFVVILQSITNGVIDRTASMQRASIAVNDDANGRFGFSSESLSITAYESQGVVPVTIIREAGMTNVFESLVYYHSCLFIHCECLFIH